MLMFGLGAYAAVTYCIGAQLFLSGEGRGLGSYAMFAGSPITVPATVAFMFVVYGH